MIQFTARGMRASPESQHLKTLCAHGYMPNEITAFSSGNFWLNIIYELLIRLMSYGDLSAVAAGFGVKKLSGKIWWMFANWINYSVTFDWREGRSDGWCHQLVAQFPHWHARWRFGFGCRGTRSKEEADKNSIAKLYSNFGFFKRRRRSFDISRRAKSSKIATNTQNWYFNFTNWFIM